MCKIMAFMASIRGLGLSFYLLLGFRCKETGGMQRFGFWDLEGV